MAQRVEHTPAAALEQHFQHNIAVVVGINRYERVRALHTARPDAEYLARLLKDEDGRRDLLDRYQVTSFYDEQASCEKLTTYLARTLPDELRKVGGRTRVLFYFAGHGDAEYSDNTIKGYLFPQDARPLEQEESKRKLLPMAEVQQWLAELDCQHVLIILDCCSAGAMAKSSPTRSALLPPTLFWETLQRFVGGKARQVITSSAYNQKASDVAPGFNIGERDPDENAAHSPFALALFEALAADPLYEGRKLRGAGRDGVVTATELYLSISDTLYRQLGDAQTPGLWTLNQGHDAGDYVFLLPGAQVQLELAPDLTGPEHDPWPRSGNHDLAKALIEASREAAIRELIKRVEARPLVAVTGRSGSGKTSLVWGMLLPRLSDDAVAGPSQGRKRWQVLPPLRLASQAPVQALADHVSQVLGQAAGENAGEAGWLAALAAAWAAGNPDRRLLLAVDCEEALFDAAPAAERARLWALLGEAAQPDVLHVVLTVPNDRWEVPAQADGQDSQPLLPSADRYEVDAIDPFNRDGLRQVIEQPAAAKMVFLESETLITRLLDAVDKQPAALPLLTETLHRMYMRHANSIKFDAKDPRDRTLTQAYYQAEGGVAGVVADLAEQLYCQGAPGCGDASPGAHQQSMQHVLMRLVAVENGRYVCGSAPLAAFAYSDAGATARAEAILKEMTALGLAASGADAESQSLVALGHIALIEAWPRMQGWLVDKGAEWALQRELTARAAEWQPQKPRTLLWDDDPRLPLVEATLWPAGGKLTGPLGRIRWVRQVLAPKTDAPADTKWLNGAELAFIQASVSRRASTFRRIIGITAAVMIALAGLALFAGYQARQANIRAAQSQARFLAAKAQDQADIELRLLLGVEAIHATDDAGIAPVGEALTELAQALAQTPALILPLTAETTGGSMQSLSELEWDPNGRMIAANRGRYGSGLRSVLVDLDSRRLVSPTLPDGNIFAYHFDPQGRWLAAVGEGFVTLLATSALTMHCPKLAHNSQYLDAQFSPRGSLLLIGPSANAVYRDPPDGEVIVIWDPATCEKRSELPVQGQLAQLFISSDESRVAVASEVKEPGARSRVLTTVWSLLDPRNPIKLLEEETFLHATDRELERLAWVRQDPGDLNSREITVYDLSSAQVIFRQQVRFAPELQLSADGSHLAVQDRYGGELHLWNLATGSETRVLKISKRGVAEFIATPDRLLLKVVDGNEKDRAAIAFYDAVTGEYQPSPQKVQSHKLRSPADPTGSKLAFVLDKGNLVIWDLRAGDEAARFTQKVGSFETLAFSPDGNRLATLTTDAAGRDGVLRIWDASGPTVQAAVSDVLSSPLFSLEGGVLALVELDDERLGLWDAPARRIVYTFPDHQVFPAARSADGRWLATWQCADPATCESGELRVWRLHRGAPELAARFPDQADPRGGGGADNLISSDGRWIALASPQLRLLDTLTQAEVPVPPDLADSSPMAFSPTEPLLSTMNPLGEIRLWVLGADDSPQIKLLPGAAETAMPEWHFLAFSPDGRRLAATTDSGRLSVWDVRTGALLKTRSSDGGQGPVGVRSFAFGPDGATIAVAIPLTSTARLQLLDTLTLSPVQEMHAEIPSSADQVTDITFVQGNGRTLVAAAVNDGLMYVWDPAENEAPLQLELPNAPGSGAMHLAFMEDGEQAVIASDRGDLQLAFVGKEALVRAACRVVTRELTVSEREAFLQNLNANRPSCPIESLS